MPGRHLGVYTRHRVEAAARRLGFELVRRHFYSPIPELDRLSRSRWDGPLPSPGVDYRLPAATDLLKGPLAPYFEELRSPNSPLAAFDIENGSYGPVDAESLYAVLRYLQPARVLELGSGASSHVIAAANRANGGFQHVIYDPFPFSASRLGAVTASEVHALRAEEVAETAFTDLGAGDVLFVDTTHTVKAGGDVNRLVLEVLPLLAPGVVVHFHDIFLPYEYPREWIFEHRRMWAEQYLLQAFLAFNAAYQVMLPLFALSRHQDAEMRQLIPTFTSSVAPGAFWLRRL
jgi:predicted O-methyltransferase YrrM